MSSELEQIKIGYEQLGMLPEEIAEDRDMDLAAVKAALMQCSGKYRRACGQEDPNEDRLNFSDIDMQMVNANLLHLALYAEDEKTQLQACMYIRDDKKGRKDVAKGLGNTTFNILQFNENMERMREKIAQVKQQYLPA